MPTIALREQARPEFDERAANIREAFARYLETTTNDQTALRWRLRCFDAGEKLARYLVDHHFPIAGRKVLDVSCAWGGHGLAFAKAGAEVAGSDLLDHNFDHLNTFCSRHGIAFQVGTGDCRSLPFEQPFDIILALDLIEHIQFPERLASEVARLLKPGGVCILTTPPKFMSVIWGEPHWQLRGLSLLPFRLQAVVARKLFRRRYPYPLEHQYWHASQLGRVFEKQGLRWQPVARSRLGRIAPKLFWSFILISRP